MCPIYYKQKEPAPKYYQIPTQVIRINWDSILPVYTYQKAMEIKQHFKFQFKLWIGNQSNFYVYFTLI